MSVTCCKQLDIHPRKHAFFSLFDKSLKSKVQKYKFYDITLYSWMINLMVFYLLGFWKVKMDTPICSIIWINSISLWLIYLFECVIRILKSCSAITPSKYKEILSSYTKIWIWYLPHTLLDIILISLHYLQNFMQIWLKTYTHIFWILVFIIFLF